MLGKVAVGLMLLVSMWGAQSMMSRPNCRPTFITVLLLGFAPTAPFASSTMDCTPPPAEEVKERIPAYHYEMPANYEDPYADDDFGGMEE